MYKMALTGFSPMLKFTSSVGIDSKIFPVSKEWRKAGWSSKTKNIFIGRIKEYSPDVLFILKETYLNRSILSGIKKHCPRTKIIMWYGDQRGYIVPDLIKGRKGLLDCLLITNSDKKQIRIYKKFGIPYIDTFYHSFDTEEFKLWDIPIEYDVFFGGSNFKPTKFPMSKMRKELITSLYNNFKVVVHGGGWPFKTEKWVLRPKYAKELRKARINIGINHYNIFRYYNRRLFESVASGRLHLTWYIPGMENHFINKKHLVWFKSVEEALRLVKFYLKNEKERERIAKEGREFLIKNHSWGVRVKKLKKIFDKVLSK